MAYIEVNYLSNVFPMKKEDALSKVNRTLNDWTSLIVFLHDLIVEQQKHQ